MQFVFPDFLWALGSLAIPIAIHIFNFRRTKRIFFSNVALLQEVKTKTNQFRKLKNLLVLISRLAMLFFLVLAFAQPFIPSRNAQSIQNTQGLVSVYVDNSFSMQAEVGNDKALDLSTQYLNDLLKVFPKSARFQIVTNHFENKEQFPLTAKKVEDKLTELRFAPQSRSLAQVQQRQQSLLERHSATNRNQIFWFSDFQKSTAGNLEKLILDSLNQYYLVPIPTEKKQNIAIDSVFLANPFIKANESNQVNVLVRNYSQEAKENLVLKLFIENKQVSTATISIGANGTALTQFNFMIEGQGYKPCRIVFEDFPWVFDNEYFFVLNISPTIQILNLFAERNIFVESVFGNESIFKLENLNTNNIDYNRLSNAELVVLTGVESIEGELKNKLVDFVSKGGSLVIFPPAKPQERWLSFVRELGFASIALQKNDSLLRSKTADLNLIDLQNPFFKGIFEKIPNNMQMPFANAVVQVQEGNILLSHKNRRAFLSQKPYKQGNVYLCSNPLQEAYTNFAKHALFVPIMYRMATLSKSAEQRLAYTFGENNIKLVLPDLPKNVVFSLQSLQNKAEGLVRPAQRIEGESVWLTLPEQVAEAGYYQVLANEKPIALLAFNYAKQESMPECYDATQLQNIFAKQKNVQVFNSIKDKNFVQDFKEKNIQFNLWKYMLVLSLFFLFLETALIRLLK